MKGREEGKREPVTTDKDTELEKRGEESIPGSSEVIHPLWGAAVKEASAQFSVSRCMSIFLCLVLTAF